MREHLSLRIFLILSTSVVLIVAQLLAGFLQYHEQSSMVRDQIRTVAEQAVRPLIHLANDAVNSGNAMFLNGKDARSLYDLSGVLFVRTTGTSPGVAKSKWFMGIAPQRIEHQFVAPAQDGGLLAAAAAQPTGLLEEQRLYVVHTPLDAVKNGGELVAVFSAAGLAQRQGEVAWRVGRATLLITVLGVGALWWLNRRMAPQPLVKVPVVAAQADSSHAGSTTIGVLDGIAFQTNIPAFNAAVAAARSGETGAVVTSLQRVTGWNGEVATASQPQRTDTGR